MLAGVGVDVVDVPRFARAKPALLKRLFTDRERAYCSGKPNAAIHFAGRFAAKEAFLKALGTGYSENIGWKDIEIVHQGNGRVEIKTSGVAARLCRKKKIRRLHVSISHTRAIATAVVLLEG
jgi:holo-[acyl-carrier protein] synthase